MKVDDITSDLIQKLENGMYQAGSRFPSEYLLAEEYGVDKTTANKAVARLVEKGYLSRGKRGAGTFVLRNRVISSARIAIILPSPLNYFHTRIIDGAQSSALSHGYLLSILSFPGTERERYIDLLKSSDVKGALLVSFNFRLEIPTVIVDHEYAEPANNTDFVNTDNYSGGRMMMHQVLASGHRKIAIYSTRRLALIRQRRVNGFLEEMRESGFQTPQKYVYYGSQWAVDEAVENLKQMIHDIPDLSVIVCDSDDAVSVMLDAARVLNLPIPGKIAITGFGNMIGNYGGIIRIANVEQYPFRLGAMACDRLIEKIQSPHPLPPEHQLFPPILVNQECIPVLNTVT